MVEAIEQVTAEDVQQVARELFEGRQVGLTLLGRVDGINFQPEQLVC
jgi:predicted Zn-dependent peptidase